MEKKTAVIVGVGALGSHLAIMLRNHVNVRLVDYDRVETKNVMSQSHSLSSVGKNKALSLQQTIKFLYGVVVEATPHKLVASNVKENFEMSCRRKAAVLAPFLSSRCVTPKKERKGSERGPTPALRLAFDS